MFNYYSSGITNTSAISSPEEDKLSVDKMLEILDKFNKVKRTCILKIWKGPNTYLQVKDLPSITYSKLIPDGICYIMAGVGIIAGIDAFDYLMRIPIVLEWSENYIPLEDQNDPLAKVLLKWETEPAVKPAGTSQITR